MYNRKFGKKESVKPYQLQSILGQINKAMDEMNIRIQNLNLPTSQIQPITAPKETSNVVFTVQSQETPKIGLYEAYLKEIKEAKTIREIEMSVKSLKKEENLLPKEKIDLENIAKELSKEMYND